jgi:transposase-like protein
MRYTDDERREALKQLAMNKGDVVRTARETEIPVRTLRTWCSPEELTKMRQSPKEKRRKGKFLPPDLLAQIEKADAIYTESVMDQLRNKLMAEALELVTDFSATIEDVPSTSKVLALTRLIDRILKLDERKPRIEDETRGVHIFRQEFKYPDGTVSPRHPVPDHEYPSGRLQRQYEENIHYWEERHGRPAPGPFEPFRDYSGEMVKTMEVIRRPMTEDDYEHPDFVPDPPDEADDHEPNDSGSVRYIPFV